MYACMYVCMHVEVERWLYEYMQVIVKEQLPYATLEASQDLSNTQLLTCSSQRQCLQTNTTTLINSLDRYWHRICCLATGDK